MAEVQKQIIEVIEEERYCVKCHQPVSAGADRCPKCGGRTVSRDQIIKETAAQIREDIEHPKKPPDPVRWLRMIPLAVGVLVLLAIAMNYFITG